MRIANPILILRWLARVWSIASLCLLSAFLFGEGFPPLTVKILLFPFGVMAGLVVAWRFERAGGAVAALSVLLFYALEYISRGRFPGGPWFFLFAGPSLFFLLAGYMKAKMLNDGAKEPDND